MSRNRLLLSVLMTASLTLTIGAPAQAATPSPAASQHTPGERYLTIKVNGEETRYLAPARNDKELQLQINAHLKRAPGGEQISKNQISYLGGRFIMTFALPGQTEGTDPTRVASDDNSILSSRCGRGWFCFFDGVNFTYPRGQLSDCGWQDLQDFGWSDRTESAAQNLAYGWVEYQNHTSGGHGNDVHLFHTDTLWDEDSNVAPYRNMADHVWRSCPL
jgi:hypothetical protein